jgi:hypothetical protein
MAYAQCALPNQLTNGQTADASEVMANFNALIACLNPGGSTNSIQYNAGAGALGGVGPLTDGQLLIGSTGNPPQGQTFTAGAGITITNGPGSVSVASNGAVAGNGLYYQVMSATPTAASTGFSSWLNQGTSTVSDSSAGITIDAQPSGSTLNISGRYKSVPATPYTVKALITATRSSNNYSEVGIGWYDGSAKLHLLSFSTNAGGPNFIAVTKWNSATSFNSSDYASSANAFSQPIWFQLQDDGTNISFAFSQDGANFLQVYSVAKVSGFLGASGYSNLIFWVNPRGATRTLGTLMSWTQ